MNLPGNTPTTSPSSTVVVLHRGGPTVRGTEAVLIRSAKALAASGYRLIVCRRNACIDAPLAALSPRPEFIDFSFPEMMVAASKDCSLPFVAYARELFRLKALVERTGPTLLYCSGGLPCQLALPVGRLKRIPVLCHFHHPVMRRAHYLWLAKYADQRVFPSTFVQRHSPSSPGHLGTVIYNGIDVTRFRPAVERDPRWREHWGIAADATVIGQVGALAANKRPEFLLATFQALLKMSARPIHLCLVGSGPMEVDLRRLIRTQGLDRNVTLTGYVDDVLPYYQHVFDINTLVSTEEGLGISVIEGSACAMPAVVTNCTGLPETIIEGETGLLFELNDSEGLRRQLLRLTENRSLRKSMGQAGHAFAERQFSAVSYDEKFMAVVSELLARKGADV
ncbi:MAG: glycosyltransferase family 4 protein [Pseudomonadota bacterium]|nr:glycosyltransferase family 4 protein [Pseudomonadota bacterium]